MGTCSRPRAAAESTPTPDAFGDLAVRAEVATKNSCTEFVILVLRTAATDLNRKANKWTLIS